MRKLNVLLKQVQNWLRLVLKIMNMWRTFTPQAYFKTVYWWTSEGFNKFPKQLTPTQAMAVVCCPRTALPLQFGLPIILDNHLASKWLNNILYKLGFAVSYDEVNVYECLIEYTQHFFWKRQLDGETFLIQYFVSQMSKMSRKCHLKYLRNYFHITTFEFVLYLY